MTSKFSCSALEEQRLFDWNQDPCLNQDLFPNLTPFGGFHRGAEVLKTFLAASKTTVFLLYLKGFEFLNKK